MDAVDDRCHFGEGGPQGRRLAERAVRVGDDEDGAGALAACQLPHRDQQAVIGIVRITPGWDVVVDGVLEHVGLILPSVEQGAVTEGDDRDHLATGSHIGGEGAHAFEDEVQKRPHAATRVEGEGDVERDLLHEHVVATGRHVGLIALRSAGP